MNQISDKPLWTVKECGQFLGVGKHVVKVLLEEKGVSPCYEKSAGRGTCYMYTRADVLNAFSNGVIKNKPLVAQRYDGAPLQTRYVAADPHAGKSKIGYCWLTFNESQQLREALNTSKKNMGDWMTEAVMEKLQANSNKD